MAATLEQINAQLKELKKTIVELQGVASGQQPIEKAFSSAAITNLQKTESTLSSIVSLLDKAKVSGNELSTTLQSVSKEISRNVKQATQVVYKTVPDTGKVVDRMIKNPQQYNLQDKEKELFSRTPAGQFSSKYTQRAKDLGVEITRSVKEQIRDIAEEIDSAISSGNIPRDVFFTGTKNIRAKEIIKSIYGDVFKQTAQKVSQQTAEGINEAARQSAGGGGGIPPKPPDPVPPDSNNKKKIQDQLRKAIQEQYKNYLEELNVALEQLKLPTSDKKRFRKNLKSTASDFLGKEALSTDDLEQSKSAFDSVITSARNYKKILDDAFQVEKRIATEAKKIARERGEAARGAYDPKKAAMLDEEHMLQKAVNAELDKEIQRRQKAGILTEQQVATLKQTSRFRDPVQKAEDYFAGYNIPANQIQMKTTEYGKTGITSMKAEARDASGALMQFNQTIDRFGRTMTDIPKRIQGFGDKLRNNAKDFLQWTLIAGTFYSVFQKITEISSLAIKNQEELANITVALGKAQSDSNKIFEDAYQVSKLTGEGLNGVLEGYSFAYRLTSEYADATERATVTNKLMVDSLVLSKLSTLDQAAALDVLVAGLEQSGQGLDKGASMLDKWVAISKQSNVDLASLAQAYATVGTSAENAGFSMEEVAALTSALGKAGLASGKELGNQLRTIISGFQSVNAEKALGKYGIAIKDMNGELRSTDSLLREIAQKSATGIIDPTALSEITLAVGGGARGQQRVAAAIRGYQEELAKINSLGNVEGAAQEALGIKLETVATSVEKLQNAFQKLAQTIGTDNGLLDLTKGLVDILTQAIEVIDKIASISGSAFLPMIATIAGTAYAGRGGGKNAVGNIAEKVNTFAYGALNPLQGTVGIGNQNLTEGGNRFTRAIGNNAFGLAGGAVSVGAAALTNLASGNESKALGNAIGGIAGLALGTAASAVLGPFGPILGANIGSAAGEGFVNFIEENKNRLKAGTEAGATSVGYFKDTTTPTPELPEEVKQRLLKELLDKSQTNLSNLGGIELGLAQTFNPNYVGAAQKDEETNKLYADILNKGMGIETPEGKSAYLSASKLEEGFTLQEEALLDIARVQGKFGNDSYIAPGMRGAAPVTPDVSSEQALILAGYGADAAKAIVENIEKGIPEFKSLRDKLYPQLDEVTNTETDPFLKSVSGLLTETLDSAKKSILSDRISGDLGSSEYRKRMDAAEGIPAGFKDFAGLVKGIDTSGTEGITSEVTDALNTYSDFVIKASTDEKNALNSYIATIKISDETIAGNAALLENSNLSEEERKSLVDSSNAAEAEKTKALEDATFMLEDFTKNLAKSVEQFNVQSFDDLSKNSFDVLYKAAEKMFSEQLKSQADFSATDERTPEWVQKQLEQKTPITLDLKDFLGTDEYNEQILAILSSNLEELKEQTGIMEQQNIGLGFYDQYSSDVLQQAANASVQIANQIAAQNPNFDPNIEESLAVSADGTLSLVANQQIMNYLLGKIEENTAKQVEGLYNMPEGSSFYFPSSAISALQGSAQGGGGYDISGMLAEIKKMMGGEYGTGEEKPALLKGAEVGAMFAPAAKTTETTEQEKVNWDEYQKNSLAAYRSGVLTNDMVKKAAETATTIAKEIEATTKVTTVPVTPEDNKKVTEGDTTGRHNTGRNDGGWGDDFIEDRNARLVQHEKIVEDAKRRAAEKDTTEEKQPNFFENLFAKGTEAWNSLFTPGKTSDALVGSAGMAAATTTEAAPTVPQIGLKLQINSSFQVNLDGRQIWNAIKVYARNDLLSYEGTSGATTQNVSVTV